MDIKLAMNKFRVEMRRFLTIRRVRFWNSLPTEVGGANNLISFKGELDKFMRTV